MKRQTYITIAAIVAALVLSQVNTAFAQQKRRVLIGFHGPSTRQAANERANAVRSIGGDVHHAFHVMPVVSAELPEVAIAQLQRRADVTYVEDDIEWHALDQTAPYGISRIYAPIAWPLATGAGVNVAVLDTGVDYDHEDLAGNFAGGVNWVGKHPKRDGSTDPSLYDDINEHGTHCAGIIAAVNNGIGVVGVAPGASIWAVKVLGDNGSGSWTDIAQGIEWCIDNGDIQVISMSLGGGYSITLENACAAAYAANILVVAGAGNTGGAVIYPAAFDSVMAISSISYPMDRLPGYSSRGPEIELTAPGSMILSTVPGDGYAMKSGTSMACPHVSGVAALLWQSMDSASSIREQLEITAQDIGLLPEEQGFGLVNAAAAVGASQEVTDLGVVYINAPDYIVPGTEGYFIVQVKNMGTQAVGAGVGVTLEDITDSITITKYFDSDIEPGDVQNVIFYYATSIGEHVLEASLDLDDDNPLDDSMTKTVQIEAAFMDIAISDVSAPASAVQGDVVVVNVTVENFSNLSFSNINVYLWDGEDLIDTKIVSFLAPGASTILTFDWDTATASLGDHTLTASHDFIDDDDGNNSLAETVEITQQGALKPLDANITFVTAGPHLKIFVTVVSDGSPVEGIAVYAERDGGVSVFAGEQTDSAGQVVHTLKGGASTDHTVILFDLVDACVPEMYEYDQPEPPYGEDYLAP